MQEHVRCALQSQDESTDGLEDTESGNALVIQEFTVAFLIALGGVTLQQLSNNAHISVAQLLAECDGKRCELSREDLYKVLHDVGQSINIDFVGKLEQLLHDLGDVLLHRSSNDVVSDQRLESKGGLDSDRELGVGHTLQDISVNDHEVVRVLEIQLLKFLKGVARTGTEEPMGTAELGENMSHKEIFDLLRDRTLLTKDDGGERTDHPQSALLLSRLLLVIRGGFISANDAIDECKNREGLLLSALGERHQEVRRCNVWRGNLFVVVQLSVEVLWGVGLEELDIFIGLAHNGEDKVSNQVLHVRLQVIPHRLRLDTFLEEDEGVGKSRLAQPLALRHPLVNFLQVSLEDLWGERSDERLGELGIIRGTCLGNSSGVSISKNTSVILPAISCVHLNRVYGPDEETVEVCVGPLLALPPVVELSCLHVLAHCIRRGCLGNNSQEQGAPIDRALMRFQMRWELKLK